MKDNQYLLHLIKYVKGNINYVKEIFEDYYTKDRVEFNITQQSYTYKRALETTLDNISYDRLSYYIRVSSNYKVTLSENEIKYIEDTIKGPESQTLTVRDLIEHLKHDDFSLLLLGYLYKEPLYEVIVYFPEETISNERDNSDTLLDVFVCIYLSSFGTILEGFRMKRSTILFTQWATRYCHSHCPSFSFDYPEEWLTPCLGTGPINQTIFTLEKQSKSPMWDIFVLELHQYLQVESISGGPYKHLTTNRLDFNTKHIVSFYYNILLQSDNKLIEYVVDKIKEDVKKDHRIVYKYNSDSAVNKIIVFDTPAVKLWSIILEHYLIFYNKCIEEFFTLGHIDAPEEYSGVSTMLLKDFVAKHTSISIEDEIYEHDVSSDITNRLSILQDKQNYYREPPHPVIEFKGKIFNLELKDNITNTLEQRDKSIPTYPCLQRTDIFIKRILTELLISKYDNNKSGDTNQGIKIYI